MIGTSRRPELGKVASHGSGSPSQPKLQHAAVAAVPLRSRSRSTQPWLRFPFATVAVAAVPLRSRYGGNFSVDHCHRRRSKTPMKLLSNTPCQRDPLHLHWTLWVQKVDGPPKLSIAAARPLGNVAPSLSRNGHVDLGKWSKITFPTGSGGVMGNRRPTSKHVRELSSYAVLSRILTTLEEAFK